MPHTIRSDDAAPCPMTAAAFPPKLTDPRAFEIALALLEGFDRHYRLFRATSAEA